MKLCTVFDIKAERHFKPFCVQTTTEALRSFSTAVKDSNTELNKFPSDFTLIELAEFDEVTGKISPHDQHMILANATEFIQ